MTPHSPRVWPMSERGTPSTIVLGYRILRHIDLNFYFSGLHPGSYTEAHSVQAGAEGNSRDSEPALNPLSPHLLFLDYNRKKTVSSDFSRLFFLY